MDRAVSLLTLLTLGCPYLTEADLAARLDLDGDGLPRPEDCDDRDPSVGSATTWFSDADADTWGSQSTAEACVQPEGFAARGGDCDDGDPAVSPGAVEVCDGIDGDCDGTVDEPDAADAGTWHADADDDGYGAPEEIRACSQPEGTLTDASDCDDGDPGVHPGAAEVWYDGVDQDCAGGSDADQDRDGCDADFAGGEDCDDLDPLTHPGMEEACGDEVDNDCDGALLGACAIHGTHTVAEADYVLSWYGLDSGDASLAALGDHDGDGDDDLLIGATALSHGDDLLCGGVLLVPGPLTGDVDLAHVSGPAVFGESDYAFFGASVAAAGDLTADGRPDVLVYADPSEGEETLSVFSGPLTGTLLASDATATFVHPTLSNAHFAALGDQDGDGVAEVAVGGSAEAGPCVFVHRGPLAGTLAEADADLRLDGETPGDCASTVASAGDLDGDGIQDLAVGAYCASYAHPWAGAVYLVLGPLTSSGDLGALATARWDGEAEDDRLGLVLAGAGDLDGDGRDEVAARGGSAVYVLGGARTGSASAADAVARIAAVAWSLPSAVGDLNGDGRGDLVVTGPGIDDESGQAGAACVFLGALAGALDLADADGLLSHDGTSGTVEVAAGAGDLDADGFPDLALGVPRGNADSGANEFFVFVFVGGVE